VIGPFDSVLNAGPNGGRPDRPCVLSIAGFDNTAGAGILADIKTFELFGLYSVAVPTAITVQTAARVLKIRGVEPGIFTDTLDALLASFQIAGIKIGMLWNRKSVQCVAKRLSQGFEGPVVLDPVIFSSSGKRLLRRSAQEVFTKRLLPTATVVTPNVEELSFLTGAQLPGPHSVAKAAKMLLGTGCRAVVVKPSGRFGGQDLVLDSSGAVWIAPQTELGRTRKAPNVHGTGCFHSAALLSLLVTGKSLVEAARIAKLLTETAILTSSPSRTGGANLIEHSAVASSVPEFF